MKSFYHLLSNSLIANVTNFFMWSTTIYWAYLTTNSVLVTSIISGIYLVSVALSGFWLGSIVDHNKKKTAMLLSSIVTLILFSTALLIYSLLGQEAFSTASSPYLWVMIVILLFGVLAGNIRMIALPTLVGTLVPEDMRARANGMTGTVFGISFAISNVAAGFGLGFFGMQWVLITTVILTSLAILHLLTLRIHEEKIVPIAEAAPNAADEAPAEKPAGKIDIRGTLKIVRTIPGLLALIFFTTFNNFLGGVFMSLMDPYGLSLVSVQVWGTLWGVLSLGFIVGGLIIAKRGVGKNPVRTLFNINIITWTICIFMAIQPSIILLAASMFIYLCVMPFIEASEQTVIQKVVPKERLGRVFGFAQSVEQAASPVTAFLIGPIAQFIFIPFMTTGLGVELIGDWYGTGIGRGIGLVFSIAGIVGLTVTLIARSSRSAKSLSAKYMGVS